MKTFRRLPRVGEVDRAAIQRGSQGVEVVVADSDFMRELQSYSDSFSPATAADDVAIFQYTSGTTRELPEVTDEFAKSVGGWDTTDQMREVIAADIRKHREAEAVRFKRNQIDTEEQATDQGIKHRRRLQDLNDKEAKTAEVPHANLDTRKI